MKLLFVCTGNTCRSPLAEAIARKVAIERGLLDVEVSSAGTSAWDGASASDGALLVGMERHLDLSSHRSRQLTRAIVADSDLIFTMGPHHLERVEALGARGKAFLLTAYPDAGPAGRARDRGPSRVRPTRRGASARRVVRPLPGRLVLLGHPVSHSLSPRFQNAALQAAGIPLVYEALD